MGVVLALLGILPFFFSGNNYIIRILGNVCMFSALAIALNVVVGYAGLLDLGFVAFYGLGAYLYGMMASPQLGLHWPPWLNLIIVGGLSIGFGLLLGSPSLRLVGDYLAIVTLGFGLIFVQLTNTLDKIPIPGRDATLNLTGGANGLINIDNLDFGLFQVTSVMGYFYVFLAWLALVLVAIYHLDQSRLGRAWRSMGEDALATEVMGMPTRRLKLFAFATGACIAGVTGAVFAAWQGSAFPQNFASDVLINLYAMMVLGGIGNLGGAVLGASVLSIVPEILRNPDLLRLLFYVGLVAGLLILMKPRRNGLYLLGGLVAFGLLVRLSAGLLFPDQLAAPTAAAGSFAFYTQQWILLLKNPVLPGNLAFLALIPALLAVTRMKPGVQRLIALVPALYLLAFVWEARLTAEPAVTRLLLVGGLLVVMMVFRPHGLLGRRKVEIV
jgi:branched-chain amino acid transport system permease protein